MENYMARGHDEERLVRMREQVDPENPPKVADGFHHNGHTFEKNLKCKCGKTLAQHNKNPWACPNGIKDVLSAIDAVNRNLRRIRTRVKALEKPTPVEEKKVKDAIKTNIGRTRDRLRARGLSAPDADPEDEDD